LKGDISNEDFCVECVEKAAEEFGKIDILVNNAAQQYPEKEFEDITSENFRKTFANNMFSYFYMTKAVLKYMPEGGRIINTTSVTAYRGNPKLIDYSSTKGAIVSFTRSLSLNLIDKNIRVNGVAPGPIWTPLIPATFPEEKVGSFGQNTPMKRPGQPDEIAPCYVFLASDDSSYMSGQILHPNGGRIVNG
jgi:NAD(P)-dependent dehydrogenase (short-subunit alcohol dehydrogenase family)